MSKKVLGIFLAVLLCAGMLTGCSKKAEEQTASNTETAEKKVIKLKMVTCWTPNYKLIEQDKYWLDQVNKLVGDEVEIEFFTAGELVKSKEVFDAVKNNTAQIGSDFPGYWAGKDTAFNLVASFPMWMDAYDYINWLEFGGGQAEYDRIYGNFGIKPLPHGPITVESGPRSTKPIKTLADYKGLKLRMSGKTQGQILGDIGASQVSISSSEVYQAMQKGVIDAAESCTPEFDWGLGYGEITQFSSHPGWHQPGSMCNLLFNQKTWDSLPQRVKDAFTIAAKATLARTLAFQDYSSADGTQKFSEKNVQSFVLPEKDLKVLSDKSLNYLYKEAEANPSFAKIALSMGEYLHHYSPWRKLAFPFNHGWVNNTLPDLDKLRSYAK